MRHYFALLLALLSSPQALLAQPAGDSDSIVEYLNWPGDPSVNVPICTAPSHQLLPTICADGAGGAIIAWADLRSGDFDVYVQRLDAAGQASWAPNGVRLSFEATVDYNVVISPDGEGGAVIAWTDWGSGTVHIRAQRVSPAGSAMWAAGGVLLDSDAYREYAPAIAGDGEGGAIIAWPDTGGAVLGTAIYAQRVDRHGNLRWGPAGIRVHRASEFQRYPVLVPDGIGGASVYWIDGGSGGREDLYGQRLNSDGGIVWATGGVPICTDSGRRIGPQAMPDGTGGAIVSWTDTRSPASTGIYAQRLNAAGFPLWAPQGLALSTNPGPQARSSPTTDGAGGAIIAWHDARDRVTNDDDIYAQRVSDDGRLLWAREGVPVCTAAAGQINPACTGDGIGGAILTWEDERGAGDVFSQRVSATGDVMWTTSGVPVCTAPGTQPAPQIIAAAPGAAIVAWYDYRGGITNPDIYAQRIPYDDIVSVTASIVSAESRPGSARIEWATSPAQNIQFSIHRRTPTTTWTEVASGNPDGVGRMVYEDRAVVADNEYGWRLSTPGIADQHFGEIWLRIPKLESFGLHGATPNPAAGALTVSFSLAGSADATIDLFDISGRLLTTRRVSGLGPGRHLVVLAGEDQLESGVYLVRLTSAGNSLVCRITVTH